MVPSRSRRTPGAAAALAQTAAGLAAHVGASGCLPSLRGLALAVPLSFVAALAAHAVLRPRVLAALTGGQLAVHLALAAVAACTGGAHAHSGSALAMTAAHAAALLVCRAALGHVEDCAARFVAALVRLVRPVRLDGPVPVPRVAPAPVVAARPSRRDVVLTAPRRGPPAGRLVAAPA